MNVSILHKDEDHCPNCDTVTVLDSATKNGFRPAVEGYGCEVCSGEVDNTDPRDPDRAWDDRPDKFVNDKIGLSYSDIIHDFHF